MGTGRGGADTGHGGAGIGVILSEEKSRPRGLGWPLNIWVTSGISFCQMVIKMGSKARPEWLSG